MKYTPTIQENKNCYASANQRIIILDMITHNILNSNFFLTGGTALSVFYLHHRTSNDLDFFTYKQIDLAEIDFHIKTIWKNSYTKIKDSPTFLSVLIQDVKVDFVIDPVSIQDNKYQYAITNDKTLVIDTIRNIVSNKLCTLVSRIEPKDFIDFYYIQKILGIDSLEPIYDDARNKDAVFDDPPTVAFQIEQGLEFLKKNPAIIPPLVIEFDITNFIQFYNDLIHRIYHNIKEA